MRSHRTERNARTVHRLAPWLLTALLCTALAGACDDDDSGQPPGDDTISDAGDTAAPGDLVDADPDADDDADAGDDTSDPNDTTDDAADADDTDDADASPSPDYLTSLASEDDFDRLRDGEDQVKYLFNAEGATPLEPLTWACTFQNSGRFPYHIQFLHTFEELAEMTFQAYTAAILTRETRVWWGGELQRWPRTPHPGTGQAGVMIYTLYTGPSVDEAPTVAEIVEVDTRMRECAPFAADTLVFLPTDPWQEDVVEMNAQALTDAGVATVSANQLIP